MEEEKLTAQTSTENESVQVGNAEPDEEKQVDASENVSDAEFAEYTADAVNNGSGDAEQVQKDSGQSGEVNSETNKKEFGKDSEQARMRRERDKKIALERELRRRQDDYAPPQVAAAMQVHGKAQDTAMQLELDRETLLQGIVLSEVLGPPRGRRPFRPGGYANIK